MSTLQTTETKPKSENRLFITPLANITGHGEQTTVTLDLPGVSRDGLEITIEDQRLSVVGRKSTPTPQASRIHAEIRDLDYRRVFELAPSIDTTRIVADLKDGVLTLTLPVAEKIKPRRITVS